MAIKLKYIKLKNYCGYRNFELELKNWNVLFGPNGSFKTNFLNAVRMLSSPHRYVGKTHVDIFRKITYHPNYQPGMAGFDKNKTEMYMEGIFDTEDGEKKVVIKNNWIPEESGTVINELTTKYREPYFHIDADWPPSLNIFQLISDYKKEFLDVAEQVYGLKCFLSDKREDTVEEYDEQTGKYIIFCMNFIIEKQNNTKVNFKSMSGGEKKIAVMLRLLFNRCYKLDSNNRNIILIDNIAKEIYYKRHMTLIGKLQEYFPNKQFIITTHSPEIIREMDKKYLIDMENYIG